MLGSLVAHVVALVIGAASLPPINPVSDDTLVDEQRYAMPTMFNLSVAAGEHGSIIEETTIDRPGELGLEAGHESGLMGEELAELTAARYAVAGPDDNPDPHLSRYRRPGSMSWSTALSFSQETLGSNARAVSDPRGRDDSFGTDPTDARGHLSGRKPADSLGSTGLGLDGIGETAAASTGLGRSEQAWGRAYRCRMP